MKGFVRLTLIGGLFLTLLLLLTPAAKAQKSGAYYWGDGDGSGSMAGPDLNVLYQVIANPGVNDSIIYGGYPQSRYRQDLDGNGSIAGPDANVMYGWAAGNFSNRPGNPDRLLLDGTTNLSVQIGDSVTLQAYALSPAAIASALRTGLGVNFQITGGTCTTNAQIYGYNVAGGSTASAWRNPSAYHYLPTRLAPDNGRVWVRARGNTCTNGQTTIIKVYIPSDAHSGSSGSRLPSDIVAQLTPTNSTPVNFTITWKSLLYVTAIAVNPSSTSLANGSTTHFTADCTWSDAHHTDCTNDVNTTWGDTGNLTQQSPTNTFLGSGVACPADGTGTVTATYNDGSNPQVSNTSSVTVTNPLQSVSVDPTSAIERAGVGYRLTGTCLGGTTSDVTAGSTMSGGCSGSAGGPATMGWTCGSAKPPTDCTITETVSGSNKTADITLNNDPSDAIVGASCAINGADVQEGSSAALGCIYAWNNSEGNCGDADAAAQVMGTTCSKDGANGLPGVKCGNTAMNPDWTCTISFGATAVATFTGQDRNDAVSNISCSIAGTDVQEGSSAALGCAYTFANGEGVCGDADADAQVTGTTCSKDGTNGLPGVKCGDHAMNPDWTCTISFGATSAITKTFTGQDRNDAVTGASCSINGTDVQEGSSAALGCTYTWANSEGTCGNADADAQVTGTTCSKDGANGLPGVKCGNTAMNPDWTCTIAFGATTTITQSFTGQDRNDAVSSISCTINGTDVQEGSSAALGCAYTFTNSEGVCGNADAEAKITGTTCSKDGVNGLPGVKCGNTAMNPDWTCTIAFGATSTITQTFTGQDRNDAVTGVSCTINGTDVQEGSSAALGCGAYTFDNGEGSCGNAEADAQVTGTTCSKDGANGLPGVKCGNTAMNPDWTCTIAFGATTTITQSFTGQDRNDAVTGAACTINGMDVQEGNTAPLGCVYTWAHSEGSCGDADPDAQVTGTTCSKVGSYGLPGVKCGNKAMNPDWTCTISFGATTTATQSFIGQDRNDAIIGTSCSINGTAVQEGSSAALGCAYTFDNSEGVCGNADADAKVTGTSCSKDGVNGLPGVKCGNTAMNPDWTCTIAFGATTTITQTFTGQDRNDAVTGAVCTINGTDVQEGSSAALGCAYSWANGEGNCNGTGWNANTDASVTGTTCSKDGNNGLPGVKCGNHAMNPDWTCTIAFGATITNTFTFTGQDRNDAVTSVYCSIAGTDVQEGSSAALGCAYTFANSEGSCGNADPDAKITGTTCTKDGNNGLPGVKCGNTAMNPDWTCTIAFGATTTITKTFTGQDRNDAIVAAVCTINGTDVLEGSSAALGCAYTFANSEGNCGNADADAQVTGTTCSKDGNRGLPGIKCGNTEMNPDWPCTIAFGATTTITQTFNGRDRNETINGASCAIAGKDVQEGSSAILGCTYSWTNNEGNCNWYKSNANADAKVTGTTCSKSLSDNGFQAHGLPGVKCGNHAMNPDWTCTIAFGATVTNTFTFTGQDRNDAATPSCAINGTDVQEGSSAALGCTYTFDNGEGVCGNANAEAKITGTTCFKDGTNGLPGVKCGNTAMNPDWTCTIGWGATSTITQSFIGQDRNDTIAGAACTIAGTNVQEGSSAALGCLYSWDNGEGNCNGTGWNATDDASVTGTTCFKDGTNGLPGVKCGNHAMNPDWTCTIAFGATITDTFTFTGQDRNDAVSSIACSIAGTDVQEGSSAALGCAYTFANSEGSCGDADADAHVTGTTCSKDGVNGLPGVKCGNHAMNPDWTCTIAFGSTSAITKTFTGQDRNDAVTGVSCTINGTDVQEGSSAALGCGAYTFDNGEGSCGNADADAKITGTTCSKDGTKGLPGVKCGNTAMNPDWTCTIAFGATTTITQSFIGQDRNDAATGAHCAIAGTDVQEGSSAALGCLYSWANGEGNCNGTGWNATDDASVTGSSCSKDGVNGLPGVKCGNHAMNPDWTCTIAFGTTVTNTYTFTGQDRNDAVTGISCAINGTNVQEGSSAALGCAYTFANSEGSCGNADADAHVTGTTCSKDGADGLPGVKCGNTAMNPDWTCTIAFGATSTITQSFTGQDRNDAVIGAHCAIAGTDVQEGSSAALGCLYSWDNGEGNCNGTGWNANTDASVTGTTCSKDGVNGLPGVKCGNHAMNPDWTCTIAFGATITDTYTFTGQDRNDAVSSIACSIAGTDVQEGSSAALGCAYTFANSEGSCGNADADAQVTGTTCSKDGTNGLPGVKCGNHAMNPDWTCTIAFGSTSAITKTFTGQDRNDAVTGVSCTINGTDVQEGSSAALGCGAYTFDNGEGSCGNADADAKITGTTCSKDGTKGLPGVKCGNTAMNPDWTCTIAFGATTTITQSFIGQDRNDAATGAHCAIAGTDVQEGSSAALGCLYSWANGEGNCNGTGWNATDDASVTGTTCSKDGVNGLPGVKCGNHAMNPDWTCTIAFGTTVTNTYTFTGQDRNDAVTGISCAINGTNVQEGSSAALGCAYTFANSEGSCGNADADAHVTGTTCSKDGADGLPGVKCGNTAMNPDWTCTIAFGATSTITQSFTGQDRNDAVIGAHCTIAGTDVQEGSSAALGCLYSWDNGEGNCNGTGWNANTDASVTGTTCSKDGVNGLPGVKCGNHAMNPDWTCTIAFGATITDTYTFTGQDRNDAVSSIACSIAGTDVQEGSSAALGCAYTFANSEGSCGNADADAQVTGTTCSKDGTNGLPGVKCGNHAMNPDWTCTIAFGSTSAITKTFTGQDRNDAVTGVSCTINGTDVQEGSSAALGCGTYTFDNGEGSCGNADADAKITGTTCSKDGTKGLPGVKCGNTAMNPDWTCTIAFGATTTITQSFTGQDRNDAVIGAACTINGTDVQEGSSAALGCSYSWANSEGSCGNADPDASVTGTTCSKDGNNGLPGVKCGNHAMNPDWTCTIAFGATTTATQTFTGQDRNDAVTGISCAINGTNVQEGSSAALGCAYTFANSEGSCGNADADAHVTGTTCSKDGADGLPGVKCGNTAMNPDWTCTIAFGATTTITQSFIGQDRNDAVTGAVCTINGTDVQEGSSAALGCLYSWANGEGDCNGTGWNANTDASVTGTTCSKNAGRGLPGVKCGNHAMNPDWTCTIAFGATITDTYTFTGQDRNDAVSSIACSIAGTDVQEGSSAALGCAYTFANSEGSCGNADADAQVTGTTCSKDGTNGLPGVKCGNHAMNPDWTCTIAFGSTSAITKTFTGQDRNDAVTGVSCTINGTDVQEGSSAALGCGAYTFDNGEGSCGNADADAKITGTTCSKDGTKGLPGVKCGNTAMNPDWTCTIAFGATTTITQSFTGQDRNDAVIGAACTINGTDVQEGSSAALGCSYSWANSEGSCGNADPDASVTGTTCSKDGNNGLPGVKCGNHAMNPDWTCTIAFGTTTTATQTFTGQDRNDAVIGAACTINGTDVQEGSSAALGCAYTFAHSEGSCGNADADAHVTGTTCSKDGTNGLPGVKCGNTAMNPDWTCTIAFGATTTITQSFIGQDRDEAVTGAVCTINGTDVQEGSSAALGCLYSWANGEGDCNGTGWNANTDASVTGTTCSKDGVNGLPGVKCGNHAMNPDWTCTIAFGATITDTFTFTGQDRNDAVSSIACSIAGTDVQEGSSATLGCAYTFAHGEGSCGNADADAHVTGTTCSKDGTNGLPGVKCGNKAMNPDWTCTIAFGATSAITKTFTGQDRNDVVVGTSCAIAGADVQEGSSAVLGCTYTWDNGEGICGNADAEAKVTGSTCAKSTDTLRGLPGIKCGNATMNPDWTCTIRFGSTIADSYTFTGQDRNDAVTGAHCTIAGTDVQEGSSAALGCLYSWANGEGNCNGTGWNATDDASVTGTTCSKDGSNGLPGVKCGNHAMNPDWTCTIAFGTTVTNTYTFTGQDRNDAVSSISCAIDGTDVQEGSSAALGCAYTFAHGEGTCGDADADAHVTGTTCSKDGINGLPGVKCGNAAMNPDWTCTIGWGATSAITKTFTGQDRNDAVTGAACTINGTDVQEGSSAALGCLYSWDNGEGNCNGTGWNANTDAKVTGTTCSKDGVNGLPGVKCGNTAMNPDWTCTIAFGATITDTYSFTGQDRNDAATGAHCTIAGTDVQEGSSAALGCLYSWAHGEGNCNGTGWDATADAKVTGTTCSKDGDNGLPGVKCGNHAMNPDWTCTIAFGSTIANTYTFTGQDRNDAVTGVSCTINGTDIQEGSSAALGCGTYTFDNGEGSCGNADADAKVTGTSCSKDGVNGLPGVKCGNTAMNPDWTCTIAFGATTTITQSFIGQDRDESVIGAACTINGTDVQEGSSAALGCSYSWGNSEGSCGDADPDAQVTGTTCSKDGSKGLPGVKCGNKAMNPDWTCTIAFGSTTTATQSFTGQDRNDAATPSCTINGTDVQEGSSAALGCAYTFANGEGVCGNADAEAKITGTTCSKDGDNGLPGVKCGNHAMNPDWTCTIAWGATTTITKTFTGQDRNDAVVGTSCTIAGTDVQEGSSAALGCIYAWDNGEGNCNAPGGNANTDAKVTGTTCSKDGVNGLPGIKCGNTAMNPDWTCTIAFGATITDTYTFTGQDRNDAVIGAHCAIAGTDVQEGSSAALGCLYSWANNEGNCNGTGWNANTDASVTGTTCSKDGINGLPGVKCGNHAMNPDWTCTIAFGATITNTYSFTGQDRNDAVASITCAIAGTDVQEGSSAPLGCGLYTWANGEGSCGDADAEAKITGSTCAKDGVNGLPGVKCGNKAMNPDWPCTISWGATTTITKTFTGQDRDETIAGVGCLIAGTDVQEGSSAFLGCIYSWTDDEGKCNWYGADADTDARITGTTCSKSPSSNTLFARGLPGVKCGNHAMNPDWTCTIAFGATVTDTFTFTGQDRNDAIVGAVCTINGTDVQEGSSAALGCLYSWAHNEGNCNGIGYNAGDDANVTGTSCLKSAAGDRGLPGIKCGNHTMNPDWTCTVGWGATTTVTRSFIGQDRNETMIGLTCALNGGNVAEGSSAALGCAYSWSDGEGNCNGTGWNANTDAKVTGSHCAKGGNSNNAACSEFNCDSSNWACALNWGATSTITGTYNCLNNDTILSVSIKPDSQGVGNQGGGTVNYATNSTISWTGNGTGSQGSANVCTESACNKPAKVAWGDPAGCGTLNTSSCVWTGGTTVCSERLSLTDANNGAITDGSTARVVNCNTTPVISNIFPMDFAARFKGNAHTDQIVTLLFSSTSSTGDCALSSVHMTCTGSDALVRTFTTSNCPLTGQDVACTPPSNFNPLVTYSCTVTSTNIVGSAVLSPGKTMTTGTAAAPSTPAIGGLGGGYVGGNAYSHITGVANGTVTYQFVDLDTLAAVPGKAYVQILQGTTISEWFTSTTGQLTATLPALPIKELTVGYKCGTMRCNLNTRSNNYNNYAYHTWENVDAKDGVLRLTLMDNSQGFINVWNTTHQGRYRADVSGTINPTNFSTYITPIDRSNANNGRVRLLFNKPTKLRAGLSLFAMRNIYSLMNLVSGLLTAGDSESSIALCMATDSRNVSRKYSGRYGIELAYAFGLPPLLTAPELVRSDWTYPCQSETANPGKYSFKVWNWVPGQNLPLMTLGVYANASSFSLATLSGGLNLFAFPLYVTGISFNKVPSLATWTSPSADTVVHIGQISFTNDMREVWVAPDLSSPGYDPDPSVDKRITISVQPILPLDPMRRDATRDSSQTAWWVSAMVPNSTDAQLTSKYSVTYGVPVASWDDRFVRNSSLIATGAMTGFNTGIVIFGLQLNTEIDDKDFTTFEVGYMASVTLGTWTKKVGSSQWRYWNNATTDTERLGREMTFVPSNYGDTTIIKWNQTTETGGPVNYMTLVALIRGLSVTSPKYTPIGTNGSPTGENLGLHGNSGTYSEGGVSLKVQHVGPIQSYTTTITANGVTTKAMFVERLLNLPEAISPAPDTYFYPAPAWAGTVSASTPMNRNGEMRRQFTYSTAASSSKWITRTGSGLNRRYFKFKVPGFVPPSASDNPDLYMIDLSTAPMDLHSLKSGVSGTKGTVTTGQLVDLNGHFQTQGVAVGDSVYIKKGYTAEVSCTITAVTSQTTVTWTTCTATPANKSYNRYWIKRNHGTGPLGECLIDNWFGGDSYMMHGGGCASIAFWHFYGPITLGATSVEVDIPNITPGAATLNSVSGVIPDAWEGMPSNTLMNTVWWFPPRLQWMISILNVNSGSTQGGGLGGPLNWNNQNFWATDYATNMLGTDEHFFYINFSQ